MLSEHANTPTRFSGKGALRYPTLPFGNATRTGTLRERSPHDGSVTHLNWLIRIVGAQVVRFSPPNYPTILAMSVHSTTYT